MKSSNSKTQFRCASYSTTRAGLGHQSVHVEHPGQSIRQLLQEHAHTPPRKEFPGRSSKRNPVHKETWRRLSLSQASKLSNAYLLAKFGFDAAENEPLGIGNLTKIWEFKRLPEAFFLVFRLESQGTEVGKSSRDFSQQNLVSIQTRTGLSKFAKD